MLTSFLNTILEIGAVGLALGTISFALQMGAALFLRDRPFVLSSNRPPIAVLVPAHNEEKGIEATLSRIKEELSPNDQLVVVADNCIDQTASLSIGGGADVVLRSDPSRRGKGFALAAGLRHLAARPPEIVVFIDADCQFNALGLELLARACAATRGPVQSLNLMVSRPDNVAASRLPEFAWRIRNDLRPNGYARLGLPCQLLGTGMALPWSLIKLEQFAAGHLTEDLFLGFELAIDGFPPRFFRDACVKSSFPDTWRSREEQKRRWLQGRLGLIHSHLPRLIYYALQRRDLGLLALAADLAVPPLGFLGLATTVLLLLCLINFGITGAGTPLALAALEGGMFAFSVVTAWSLCGRDLIGLREIWELPRHLSMVMRSAFDLARGHRTRWKRADRS